MAPASASATAVFPTAVGPTSTGTLAPAKPALQLLPGQLHDRGAAVHVVRRQIGGEEAEQQLAHLPLVQPLPRLDRGAAGVGGGEALQPVGPAAEPPARQVGDHLAEAGRGVEARVRRGHRVDHHRAAAERLGLEPDAAQLLAVGLDRVELLVGQLQRERQQEPLRRRVRAA